MGLPLSEIFNRLIKIKKLQFELTQHEICDKINNFNETLTDIKFIEFNELKKIENSLTAELNNYNDIIKRIENKLETAIFNNQDSYINASKKIYAENIEKMLFEEHLEWSVLWPPTTHELNHFTNQIKQFVNWQEPSLLFGAKNTSLIKSTIGTEPMYIVEQFPEYFKLQKQKFNPDFIRKMKFYDIHSINLLPKNSIGLIACYNELNFLPWNTITNLLSTFSKLLNSHGTIIFNYNNCRTLRGFKEFENHSMTYTTPEMFKEYLARFNLDCVKEYTSQKETFSFMIFQKQGNRDLIKKNPSVGFVKEQPTYSKPSEHKARIEHIEKLINNKLT